ncbi:P-loop containing nucleoside triphosphate hydrolase protein [Punctularia strigosozonata HHB-11173 SS5]|uniref:p-loop containing nucleoside triphosphate hydrolase protein n=1 Tax=Punctularia strigosozonata (strain HHB-11173) TaxID=741275 RepID=R7S499_PUNST|nr:P-loop containing nucleoside triphosphate hydrolase protein [Punctularia strigosozonata HHB-11173 SS5]EIN04674.1 P-loop containing nucleoside triphosphate hydrolase protein [Punctularia strigosozonata HHB-11173 SS5]
MYAPKTVEDLAVHKKKVEDVRHWLMEALDGGPSGRLRKYRRILALTGPAGTGKTAVLRLIADELGVEILEWRNSVIDGARWREDQDYGNVDRWTDHGESLTDKFSSFLARAGTYGAIFSELQPSKLSTPGSQASNTQVSASGLATAQKRRQVILLEDLPNVLHQGTQEAIHGALRTFVRSEAQLRTPMVVIVSDAGVRGEDVDDTGQGESGGYWRSRSHSTLDVRTVLPSDLLNGPYVTQIAFNPIAPTLLKKALQALLGAACAHNKAAGRVSKDVLDLIVQTTNGDIRSAVMALEFACTAEVISETTSAKKRRRGHNKHTDQRGVFEAVTRRESSLALFHLLGKVFYNKRKGDAPSGNASKADAAREAELDARLANPSPLPAHLAAHERRASRVDVPLLYADSPIDSSLFSLYVHQNYTQFCETMEECDGVADILSLVDVGNSMVRQANPHRFHLVALGTLHSLPSPVPRRGQKLSKPLYFDNLHKERDCRSAVEDVRHWLDALVPGRWDPVDVATGLGAVVEARDGHGFEGLPLSHRLFSKMTFTRGAVLSSELTDGDDGGFPLGDVTEEGALRGRSTSQERVMHGWLEDDEIEED